MGGSKFEFFEMRSFVRWLTICFGLIKVLVVLFIIDLIWRSNLEMTHTGNFLKNCGLKYFCGFRFFFRKQDIKHNSATQKDKLHRQLATNNRVLISILYRYEIWEKYTLKKQDWKKLEKVRFIKVNELKLTQVILDFLLCVCCC